MSASPQPLQRLLGRGCLFLCLCLGTFTTRTALAQETPESAKTPVEGESSESVDAVAAPQEEAATSEGGTEEQTSDAKAPSPDATDVMEPVKAPEAAPVLEPAQSAEPSGPCGACPKDGRCAKCAGAKGTPCEACPHAKSGMEKPCAGKKKPCHGKKGPCPFSAGPKAGTGGGFGGRGLKIRFDGDIRTDFVTLTPGYFLFIPFNEDSVVSRGEFVGRSDGFRLSSARLNMRAHLGPQLYARLGFDGAEEVYEDSTDVQGRLGSVVKDAYVRWQGESGLKIFVGNFKPPFEVESLTSRKDQYFVYRSLESVGVAPDEGFAGDMPGFAPGRQLGAMASIDLGGSAFMMRASGALTNGNSGRARNDNDLPALYARFELLFGEEGTQSKPLGPKADEEGPGTRNTAHRMAFGLSAMFNTITYGEVETRQHDNIMAFGLDASLDTSLLAIRAQAIGARLIHGVHTAAASELSFGGHIQASLKIPDTIFAPGYRFSIYDPRVVEGEEASVSADQDRVVHHSIGLRMAPTSYPLVLLADFTISVEQEARAIHNNRLNLAMQVDF